MKFFISHNICNHIIKHNDEFINEKDNPNNRHISEKDYLHAVKVWNACGMKNMGDYHSNYLRTDVPISADIFEKLINRSLKYYKLDPSHCFSSHGLSWLTMSKMTGVKLELISDI